MSREYSVKPFFDDEIGVEIYTVEQWKGMNMNYDWGIGFWMKDNMESKDDVFTTPQEDATHVGWYNK
jgi:hypothetical protein